MSSRSATRAANCLSDAARRPYTDIGYACLDALLRRDLVLRAQEAMADLVYRGRHLRASDGDYVLESSHTDSRPRLRRVYRMADGYAAADAFAYTKQDPRTSSRYEDEIFAPNHRAKCFAMNMHVPKKSIPRGSTKGAKRHV
jgi:hypothetical protein